MLDKHTTKSRLVRWTTYLAGTVLSLDHLHILLEQGIPKSEPRIGDHFFDWSFVFDSIDGAHFVKIRIMLINKMNRNKNKQVVLSELFLFIHK